MVPHGRAIAQRIKATLGEIRKQRVKSRSSFSDEEWLNRRAEDDKKFNDAFIESYVDCRIDNSGDIDTAVTRICNETAL